MFTRLVASARHRSQFRRPAVIIGSIAAHAALLAGIIWASSPDTGEPTSAIAPDEEITYIDITEIPEPEMVFEEPAPAVAAAPAAVPRSRPAQPRQAPAATPAPATPSEPAGFQELRTPPTVIGVAPPDPNVPPVRAEDFGGRGVAGGTARGIAPPEAGSGRIGTGTTGGTAGGAGGTGTGPPTGTFSANLVDRRATLRNQAEVVRLMQRLYPNALRSSGTEGSVQVQFVVTAEGRVDMSTVQVVSSSNAQFTEATLKALQEFRFTPARKGEHNVRMLTTLPVRWVLER